MSNPIWMLEWRNTKKDTGWQHDYGDSVFFTEQDARKEMKRTIREEVEEFGYPLEYRIQKYVPEAED